LDVKLSGIIYCEGVHDAWFIDEVLRREGKTSKIVDTLGKFQEIIRTLSKGKPVGDPSPTYFILPLSPNYKDEIYKRVAGQIPHLRPLAEKFEGIDIILVVDKNGEDEEKIVKKFRNEVAEFIEQRFRGYKPPLIPFTHGIAVEFKGNIIKYSPFIVPNSLEAEIFRKFKEIDKFRRHIRDITDPDSAIFIICKGFYGCRQERLFRSSVELFQNEGWFKALINLISGLKER